MRHENSTLIPRYGCAMLSMVMATGALFLLHPVLRNQVPFVLYLLAIVFSAWAGGLGLTRWAQHEDRRRSA